MHQICHVTSCSYTQTIAKHTNYSSITTNTTQTNIGALKLQSKVLYMSATYKVTTPFCAVTTPVCNRTVGQGTSKPVS